MREQGDQLLGHQFDKLSGMLSGAVEQSDRSAIISLSDVTETEGGMRVICKTIDQPVDVLAERRRRSSDTLNRRGEAPVNIVGLSAEWLLAWMERKVYRPPYLLRSLRGKHGDHKRPLGLLNQVFELV